MPPDVLGGKAQGAGGSGLLGRVGDTSQLPGETAGPGMCEYMGFYVCVCD